MPKFEVESCTCIPVADEWPALLQKSLILTRPFDLREKVISTAREFEKRIATIASERKVPFAPVSSSEHSTVAMTGHQPVVYHPGLLEKNRLLTSLLKQASATGVNVIIDTDTEDCGVIRYPSPDRLLTLTVGSGAGLILNQRVLAPPRPDDMPILKPQLELYQNLKGIEISIANTLVRLAYEGERKYLNVPFSSLAKLPEAQNWFLQLIEKGSELFQTYNSLLDEHRSARKIKNAANPFPNLAGSAPDLELPFWRINSEQGTRVAHMLGAKIEPGEFLAPRGALVTTFLRLLCSDIFIHGLGGAKYDTFTDLLIERYFKLTPPAFAAASRTRFLFANERAKYEEAAELKEQLPSIHSHLEDFATKGIFSPDTLVRLRAFQMERSTLLEQLKAMKERREDVKAVAIQLKEIDNKMKSLIAEDPIMNSKLKDAEAPPQLIDLWYCREFPFFLYS